MIFQNSNIYVSLWLKKHPHVNESTSGWKHSGWGRAPESMFDFDVITILLNKNVLDNFCSPAVKILRQSSIIEVLHT